jgi:hypothetical protein
MVKGLGGDRIESRQRHSHREQRKAEKGKRKGKKVTLETVCFSKMMVSFYKPTWCHNPEQHTSLEPFYIISQQFILLVPT